MQATSVPSLKYVLNQIQQQSSQFQNFLLTLKENTVFKPEKNPYVETFLKGMQTFNFIGRLMQDKKGQFPDLDKYKGIIRQMQQDIAGIAQPSGKGKASNALVDCLSPLGRICLSIFLNEEGSYLNLIKKWISSMDIATEWRKPFLQPVYLAYALGITEVESAVSAIWNDLKSDYISSLHQQVSLQKGAETEISPDWLKEAPFSQRRVLAKSRRISPPGLSEKGAGLV